MSDAGGERPVTTEDHQVEPGHGPIDVTRWSLEDLLTIDNTAVVDAVNRLLAQLDTTEEPIAGWSSHQP